MKSIKGSEGSWRRLRPRGPRMSSLDSPPVPRRLRLKPERRFSRKPGPLDVLLRLVVGEGVGRDIAPYFGEQELAMCSILGAYYMATKKPRYTPHLVQVFSHDRILTLLHPADINESALRSRAYNVRGRHAIMQSSILSLAVGTFQRSAPATPLQPKGSQCPECLSAAPRLRT